MGKASRTHPPFSAASTAPRIAVISTTAQLTAAKTSPWPHLARDDRADSVDRRRACRTDWPARCDRNRPCLWQAARRSKRRFKLTPTTRLPTRCHKVNLVKKLPMRPARIFCGNSSQGVAQSTYSIARIASVDRSPISTSSTNVDQYLSGTAASRSICLIISRNSLATVCISYSSASLS